MAKQVAGFGCSNAPKVSEYVVFLTCTYMTMMLMQMQHDLWPLPEHLPGHHPAARERWTCRPSSPSWSSTPSPAPPPRFRQSSRTPLQLHSTTARAAHRRPAARRPLTWRPTRGNGCRECSPESHTEEMVITKLCVRQCLVTGWRMALIGRSQNLHPQASNAVLYACSVTIECKPLAMRHAELFWSITSTLFKCSFVVLRCVLFEVCAFCMYVEEPAWLLVLQFRISGAQFS